MAQSSLLTSVKFIVKCDTIWKDDLFIVGNYPELGQWQSQRAVPLMTTGEKFTQWESPVLHLDMKRRQSALEYKYILRRGVHINIHIHIHTYIYIYIYIASVYGMGGGFHG